MPAPSAAPAPAPVAAPAPALQACAGKRIYLQIYSEEQRAGARLWTEELERTGARVPGIEDVVATALRDGRNPPRPVPVATLIYQTDAEQACAQALRQAHAGLDVRPLARGLVGTRGLLELWLPPAPAR